MTDPDRSGRTIGPMPALTFVLVPDGSMARRVRRLMSEAGTRGGWLVGSWDALIDAAQRAYLAPVGAADWGDVFATALATLEDAFWASSLEVAPVETAQAVESNLVQLMLATDPRASLEPDALHELPERPRQHMADLLELVQALQGRLPDSLAAIRELLAIDVADAVRAVRVLRIEGTPILTPWQRALVDKLNRDADLLGAGDPDPDVLELLRSALSEVPADAHPGALGVLQARLFTAGATPVPMDASVQWIGVRDLLQEAEVAAGMVQRMLDELPDLRPAEIGVLMPDSFEYALALQDAFGLAGLPLSGLPVEHWRRDLGREAVFHFLYCRQRPAAAMALAVCLSSPLMPWSREDGAGLAQSVMDGRYTLKAPVAAGSAGRAMLELLLGDDAEPAALAASLRDFVALLQGGEVLGAHVLQARETAERLYPLLDGAKTIDWPVLRRAATPRFAPSGEAPDFNREGITVWRESQEAWRPVRRLLVLGFAQGHYPGATGSNPVFSVDDLEAIRNGLGLPVPTPAEERLARRARLRRQLAATTESVTFLVPRRDLVGKPQAPSDSLVFMHPLFIGPESADERVLDIEAAELRSEIAFLPLATPAAPEPPRAFTTDDPHFDRDLLQLRRNRDGTQKPESPSGLETLLVSRLAWLLRRLDAEPLAWAPERVDPRLLGTLAHRVFEQLFSPGTPLPSVAGISARTHDFLDTAIRERAPFLLSPQWQVERQNLSSGIARAAVAWRETLEALDAEVLAGEAWLQGTWDGMPIHGQVDLILGLPADRLLVVDYKRSKSDGRRKQMEKGYDSQANLYRTMLQSGGLKNAADSPLSERLRRARAIGIVYYMMNDQTGLADTPLPGAGDIPNWQTLDNDVSGAAMVLIHQRLDEVRAGLVRLNREGDAEFFEKQAGIKPYALENSPLIALFTARGAGTEGAP